jgi:hypothetical protein
MHDNCAAAALVEKLADGEASLEERRTAEAHLSACADCRDHLEFLTALHGRTRGLAVSEPPPDYWERLPRRVMERIGSAKASPTGALQRILQALLAPGALRWQALGATVLLLAAIGITVYRDDSLRSGPESRDEGTVAELAIPPPMARDEALAPARDSHQEIPPPAASTPPSAGGPAAEPPSATAPPDREPAPETEIERESRAVEDQAFFRARAEAPAAPEPSPASRENAATPALESSGASCESLRRALAARAAADASSDLRYRLALCSIQEHERRPSDAAFEAAEADAEAFLAMEAEGPRAAEIRQKLERIRIR